MFMKHGQQLAPLAHLYSQKYVNKAMIMPVLELDTEYGIHSNTIVVCSMKFGLLVWILN